MQTLDFAVSSEYSYDAKSGRFRYSSGTSKGKFAPREAVLELTRRSIARQSEDLIALGDRLSNDSLSLRDFQRQSAELLRQIHVSSAVLGRGGSDRMTSEDWLKVARTLKAQYTDGKDPETGRRFGLKWLSEEIKEGKVTAGQLRSRLRLYANSGGLTYWDMWRRSEVDSDRPYAVRELGQAEHCDDCPKLAAQKPQSILDILLPGQGCECGTNCKCRLRALTLEEAIAHGLKDPRPAAQRKSELDAIERIGFGKRRRSSNFEEEFDYRQYVRDGRGRFAKTSGSGNKNTKQYDDEAEIQKGIEERRSRYKENGSYRYMILSGNKTYVQIEAESGKEVAEAAFEKSLRDLAVSELRLKRKKEAVSNEASRIEKDGSEREREELAAFRRLKSDLGQSTLENFKRENPGEIENLVSQYRKELDLDEKFSLQRILERGQNFSAELEEKLNSSQSEAERIEIFAAFRSDLIAKGLSRQEAIALVESISFDKIPDDFWNTKEITRESAIEFFQISGGRGKSTLDRFEVSQSRAFANKSDRAVNVGSYTSAATIFHEIGHHMEFEEKRIAAAASQWRNDRATDDIQKLNQIDPGLGYTDSEVAYPGNYITPYVGKVYNNLSTEVISVGIERFSSPDMMSDLYQKDREHFNFILGVIRSDSI